MHIKSKMISTYEETVKRREEAIKDIDKITINGATLVDGNNMFIQALEDIDLFNKKINELKNSYKIKNIEGLQHLIKNSKDSYFKRSSIMWHNDLNETDPNKKWKNVFEDYNPYYLAFYMDWLIRHLSEVLSSIHARKYTEESKKKLIDNNILDTMLEEGKVPNKDNHIFYKNNHNIYLFDAKLPDRSYQIKQLEKIKYYQKDTRVIEDFDIWIERLKKGKFPQNVNGKTLEINWDVKNDALTYLQDENLWESNNRIKVLRTPKSGIFFREKGVDGGLTLKMGDLAIDKFIDYICLVANDSDYVPGVERLIEHNKDLYLFSMCKHKFVSKELKSLIKNENQIHQIDLLNYYRHDDYINKYPDVIFSELFGISNFLAPDYNLDMNFAKELKAEQKSILE